MAARGEPIVRDRGGLVGPGGLVLAVGDSSRGPGVLADAGDAYQRRGARRFGPPSVGLGVEAEHIGGPQLLLSLGSPTTLPGPVTTLRRNMRVMLGRDWSMLPAVPLSGSAPRGSTRVGNQHSLSHDALDSVASQLEEPAKGDHSDHDASVLPRGHVDLGKGVLADANVLTVLLLLIQLGLSLGRGHQVHDMLEGSRQPRRRVARATLVEQAATRFLGRVVGLVHGRFRHGVHAEAKTDMHQDDEGSDTTSDVDHGLCVVVAVHQSQCDGGNERTTNLKGEGASVLWQHVHTEDDPDSSRQTGCTKVGTPDHAKLANVVQGDPVGEGHDQVDHTVQEADAHVGLSTPPLLLCIAQHLEVLVRQLFTTHAMCAGGALREGFTIPQLLSIP
mmetsp:Transcript_22423/g.49122  ORF Transcript_22423/g.49122 Transcript_22423/m.49122 type:complete len:389 (-) Transcript_22423:801-1967(-)